MPHILEKPVLVINAALEPLSIINVKRAMTLITKGAARVQLESGQYLHHGRGDRAMRLSVPSVIRLEHYRYIPRRTHVMTRRNILMRDRFTCQYCLQKFSSGSLTLDHVMPKSRGGPDSWQNLVAACKTCNTTKDDRTPEEAGMRQPPRHRSAGVHTSRNLLRQVGLDLEEKWRPYLFYDNTGDTLTSTVQ